MRTTDAAGANIGANEAPLMPTDRSYFDFAHGRSH